MDTVPFLLCELGAPLFTNLKGAGTYFMCIPAMNRRMYKTLVDITSAGVFCCHVSGRNCRWQVLQVRVLNNYIWEIIGEDHEERDGYGGGFRRKTLWPG